MVCVCDGVMGGDVLMPFVVGLMWRLLGYQLVNHLAVNRGRTHGSS